MKNRKKSGFTLAELLAVIAIVIILLGVLAVNVAARQRSMTRLEFDAIAKEIFIAAQNHLTAAESQEYLNLPVSAFGTRESGADESGEAVPGSDEAGSGTEDSDTQIEIYYVASGDRATHTILDQMLPRYAVDAPGTFIVRYQPHPARVLDVFYSQEGKSSFLGAKGTALTADPDLYKSLMEECKGDDKIRGREHFSGGNGPYVVGWYGGGEEIETGDRLDTPTFVIHNEEQLYVVITNPEKNQNRKGYWLNLIIEGATSGAKMHLTVAHTDAAGAPDLDAVDVSFVSQLDTGEYAVLLDDVRQAGRHFAEISANPDSGAFIPGENLNLYLVAWSSAELTNIAKSAAQTTNSLYADPAPYFSDKEVVGSDVKAGVAAIENFRHLENLEENISGVSGEGITKLAAGPAAGTDAESGDDPETGGGTAKFKAVQISDMDWEETWQDWESKDAGWDQISLLNSDTTTENKCFYPVSPAYVLTYTGKPAEQLETQSSDPDAPAAETENKLSYCIKNVKVDFDGPSGLFGSLTSNSAVSDLELIDFSVTASSGDAGALIGTAEKVAVENVLARNTRDSSVEGLNNKDPRSENITAENGSAGGLIGSMTDGKVENSAAALYVRASDAAGGLIGEAKNRATVTNSYAGGHTEMDPDAPGQKPSVYLKTTEGPARINVIGSAAGGLIGRVTGDSTTGVSADTCYTTCSVKGSAAGGLIGEVINKAAVTDSYATGLVETDDDGNAHALIGIGSAEGSGNSYLWIINQDQTWQKNIMENSPNPAADIPGGITAADADKNTTTFGGFFSGSAPAQPYNAKLIASYEGKYPMRPVSTDAKKYVSAHYGDWPMPETLVINP